MPYSNETGELTNKKGEVVAVTVDGKLQKPDGSDADGWMKAQVAKATGEKKSPAKKAAKKVAVEKPVEKKPEPVKKVSIKEMPVINEGADIWKLKSTETVPDTRWIYFQEETQFELKKDSILEASIELSNHRRYRNLMNMEANLCREDIARYTAERCSRNFLK